MDPWGGGSYMYICTYIHIYIYTYVHVYVFIGTHTTFTCIPFTIASFR